MEVGEPMELKPGHTSTIRRIEGGMLSYVADMTIDNNPFEMGFDRLVDLDMDADFIGKAALKKIQNNGIQQRHVGMELHCAPLDNPNDIYWPVHIDGKVVGKITSAVYSPRLKKNIALAMMQIDHAETGTRAEGDTVEGTIAVSVVEKPFYDPRKGLASG